MKKPVVKTPKISDTPSIAIRQALTDLEAIEKDKRYDVNMNSYHSATEFGTTCEVCFAGAVIARSGNEPTMEIVPEMFTKKVSGKLHGLDDFRQGHIYEGLQEFGIKEDKIPLVLKVSLAIDLADYDRNKKQFKKDMLQIACELEKFGL